MPSPESGEPVRRRRRVRKYRRVPKEDDLKPHYGDIIVGMNTKRIRQQIADGKDASWEGEYRE